MSSGLVQAMADMKEEEALAIARDLLEEGEDPLRILEESREAMELVGRRFSEGKYFLPELILAGEMLSRISEMTRERILGTRGGAERRLGKFVIGTVKGDIHDIGKGIVCFMLEANGFEVIDVGIDVPPECFVEVVEAEGARVLGLSGLLTLAYDPMKETVEALAAAGLRDRVKAKAIIGETLCFWGNVPAGLLITGTPDQVRDDVKALIDLFADNGGLIVDGSMGIPDEAKPENVEAMIETVFDYGTP